MSSWRATVPGAQCTCALAPVRVSGWMKSAPAAPGENASHRTLAFLSAKVPAAHGEHPPPRMRGRPG